MMKLPSICIGCYVGSMNWNVMQFGGDSPPSIQDNEKVKLLWDFNIYTDKVISARRPDITVIDKLKNLVTFVDIAVPVGE